MKCHFLMSFDEVPFDKMSFNQVLLDIMSFDEKSFEKLQLICVKKI